MLFEKSLFERIDSSDQANVHTKEIDAGAIIASVKRHLVNLFNTREGNAAGAPSYGMPDFNDAVASHPDFIKQLKIDIEQVITANEPRLRNLQIHYISDPDRPLDLNFSVRGDVQLDGQVRTATFDVSLGNGFGRNKVSG